MNTRTPTPRTEARLKALREEGAYADPSAIDVEFAQQLERELAEALAVIAKKDGALRLAKRRHNYCEDSWYSCPLAEEGCSDEDQPEDKCNCGADEHNARIDSALALTVPTKRL